MLPFIALGIATVGVMLISGATTDYKAQAALGLALTFGGFALIIWWLLD